MFPRRKSIRMSCRNRVWGCGVRWTRDFQFSMANRQFGITPNGRLLTRLEGEIAGFDRFSSKTVNFSRFSGFLAVGRRCKERSAGCKELSAACKELSVAKKMRFASCITCFAACKLRSASCKEDFAACIKSFAACKEGFASCITCSVACKEGFAACITRSVACKELSAAK